MWYVSVRERCIIILNGRQNELEVNTFVTVTVLIDAGYNENKQCHDGKKGGVAKIKKTGVHFREARVGLASKTLRYPFEFL